MADFPQHDPWVQKSFEKGANTDVEPDLSGNIQGVYYDASNMRPTSVSGGAGSIEKVGGEKIQWSTGPPGSTYVCVGAVVVGGHVMEFWASNADPPLSPLIRVDGEVMAQSPLLPYTHDHPLQFATADDCKGGLVMPVDDNSIPLLLSVDDIIEQFSLGALTYFSLFSPGAYQINAPAPCHRPRFYGLATVGGGGGLKPGQYAWSLRYVNHAGDRTNIGQESPLMAVPIYRGPFGAGTTTPVNDATGFPGASLTGAALVNMGLNTQYGARIKFRIDNRNNYERIEVIRTEYNLGAGLTGLPVRKVSLQLAVLPGQLGWHEFVDTGEEIELIPTDEEDTQRLFILKAKGVRYIEGRMVLGNVGVAPKDIDLTFKDDGSGNRVFPITKNLGTFGHADPVQHAYYKNYLHGEKYSFGVVTFDGASGNGFVVPLVDNHQMPARRDPKGGDSLPYSDAPIYAADVNDFVGPTFENFDHDDAIAKSNADPFVNIAVNAARPTIWMNVVPGVTPIPPNPLGIYQSGPNTVTSHCFPLHPTRYDDAIKDGHNYIVNPWVRDDPANGATSLTYRPRVFEPNYHSLGLGMYGVDKTSIPDGISGFSVVRRKPAGRVVCQGLATYDLGGATSTQPISKGQFTCVVYFPDMESGLVNLSVIEEFKTTPTAFRLEFQSPLGFCSELYGSANSLTTAGGASYGAICDMLSYARIQWDAGQINPLTGTAAFQPTTPGPIGNNYVGYGQWRNPPPPTNIFATTITLGISNVVEYTHASGGREFVLTLDSQLYQTFFPHSGGIFSNPDTKAFHEPIYVVNLVREGALVDANGAYQTCGHYQMMSSTVGAIDGTVGQEILLVDERLDDVLPAIANQLRYTYLTPPGAASQAWVCLTNTTLNVATILGDIGLFGFWTAPDGTQVYGVYEVVTNGQDEWLLRYNIFGSTPPVGTLVEVRYDDNAPIRLWGGDSTVAPALFPRMNSSAVATAPFAIGVVPASGPVFFGGISCALPYSSYEYNPRYFIPYGGTLAVPATIVNTVRQWCILFDCESRTPLHLSAFLDTPEQGFGHIHYVVRPYYFDGANPLSGIHTQYPTIYPNETGQWHEGGIRWRKPANYEYAVERAAQFFDAPDFFDERTDMCNAIVYSEKVSPLDMDSPGFKTYPAANIYFIEDNTGEIKRLWSANAGTYGYNLYAFTRNGVVMLPTSKSVAYSADGTTFSLTRQDQFLASEIWLTKNIGMPDEYWRASAEGSAPVGEGYQDTIFWVDKKGVYQLTGNAIAELARDRYLSGLLPYLASLDTALTCAAWNTVHNEYWFQLAYHPNPIITLRELFVYSPAIGGWVGRMSHRFDYYLDHPNANGGPRLLAFDDMGTYRLNEGLVDRNGDPMQSEVKTVIVPQEGMQHEFMWFAQNSTTKPTEVQFLDQQQTFACRILEANLRDTDGYMQAIGRTEASYSAIRNRLQQRFIFVRSMHTTAGNHRIRTLRVQAKPMK